VRLGVAVSHGRRIAGRSVRIVLPARSLTASLRYRLTFTLSHRLPHFLAWL